MATHPDEMHELLCRVLLRHPNRLCRSRCPQAEECNLGSVLFPITPDRNVPFRRDSGAVPDKVPEVRHRREDLLLASGTSLLLLLRAQLVVAVIQDRAETLSDPLIGEALALLRVEGGKIGSQERRLVARCGGVTVTDLRLACRHRWHLRIELVVFGY